MNALRRSEIHVLSIATASKHDITAGLLAIQSVTASTIAKPSRPQNPGSTPVAKNGYPTQCYVFRNPLFPKPLNRQRRLNHAAPFQEKLFLPMPIVMMGVDCVHFHLKIGW